MTARVAAPGPCPKRAYMCAGPLEAYVVTTTLALLDARRRRHPAAVSHAQELLARAEHALRCYRDNERLIRDLDPEVFAEGLLVKDRRVADARLELALAREAD